MDKVSFFQNVFDFTKKLNRCESIDLLLHTIQTHLSNLDGVATCVFHNNDDGTTASIIGEPVFFEDIDSSADKVQIRGIRLLEDLLLNGETIVSERVMLAPFYGVDGIKGAINLTSTDSNRFIKEHVKLAQITAEIISSSYQRIQNNIALKTSEYYLTKQNKFNILRADIWSIAAETSLNEEQLAQKILDRVGPELGVSRACFCPINENGSKCTVEWLHPNTTVSSIGTRLPGLVFEHFFKNPDPVYVDYENIDKIIPKQIRNQVSDSIIYYRKQLNIDNLFAFPFFCDSKLAGAVSFHTCHDFEPSWKPEWTEEKKSIANEVTRILSSRIAQLDAERKIKESEARLFEAQKIDSIGNMAGGIAHDFNNMLGGIMGLASTLIMDETDDSRRSDLISIVNITKHANELTKKLLAFGRRGKNIVQATNINDIIGEVITIVDRSISKNITIDLDLELKLATIDADPSQISQVVMNLCLNAAESISDSGNVFVRTKNVVVEDSFSCQYGEHVEPGEYILLEVSDSGSGMSKKVIQHIFEPFFTTKSDKDSAKGTGLGLSITYGIVRNHGGIFNVASKLGKGTTFSIYFPKGKKRVQKKPAEFTHHKKSSDGKGVVLIVDDERVIRNMLKRMCERLGYKAIVARDGVEGSEIYKSSYQEIDCVILDLHMPNMGGRETFEAMKDVNPDVRALLTSGYGRNEEAQELLDMGAIELIPKPFGSDTLSKMLEDLVD
jgi:signal transduction histidine kinase/CheY-like chemotaxis protein